jgi:hypothetical protein
MTDSNRPVHELQRPLLGLPTEVSIVPDRRNKRLRNDGGVVVGARTSCHGHHTVVFLRALLGQRLQFGARAKHARMRGGYGTTVFRNQSGSQ